MQITTASQAMPQVAYNFSLRERCAAALLNLNEILLFHAALDDSLSVSLRNWAEVACFELCPDNQEEEAFLDNAERQFMALEALCAIILIRTAQLKILIGMESGYGKKAI